MFLAPWLFKNGLSSIISSEDGKVKLIRLLQRSKAHCPSLFNRKGRITFSKFSQLKNACCPIAMTEFGTTICFSFLQPIKAPSAISNVFGIISYSSSSLFVHDNNIFPSLLYTHPLSLFPS